MAFRRILTVPKFLMAASPLVCALAVAVFVSPTQLNVHLDRKPQSEELPALQTAAARHPLFVVSVDAASDRSADIQLQTDAEGKIDRIVMIGTGVAEKTYAIDELKAGVDINAEQDSAFSKFNPMGRLETAPDFDPASGGRIKARIPSNVMKGERMDIIVEIRRVDGGWGVFAVEQGGARFTQMQLKARKVWRAPVGINGYEIR